MVCNSIPDKLAVITYVSQLHSYFNDLPKSVRARRQAQSQKRSIKMKPPTSNDPPVAKPKPKILKSKKTSLLAPPPRHTELEPKFHQFHVAGTGTLQRERQASTDATSDSLCCQCHKDVFLMERIVAERQLFHRACFKCAKCGTVLKLRTYKYIPQHEKFYCTEHYSAVKQALQKPSSPKIPRRTSAPQQKRRFSLEKKRAIALQSFQRSLSAPHSPSDTSKTVSLSDIAEVSAKLEASIKKGKCLAVDKPELRAKSENIPETMKMETDEADNEKRNFDESEKLLKPNKFLLKESTPLLREKSSPVLKYSSSSTQRTESTLDSKCVDDTKENLENKNTAKCSEIDEKGVMILSKNEKPQVLQEPNKQLTESDQEPPCKKQNVTEERYIEKRTNELLNLPRRRSSGANSCNITEEQVLIFRDSRKGSRPSVKELAQKFLRSENESPVKKREFNHFSKVVMAAREMRLNSVSEQDRDSPKPKGSLVKEMQSKYISKVEKSEEPPPQLKSRPSHPLFRIISVDGHKSIVDESSCSSSETITPSVKDADENTSAPCPESASTSSLSSHSTIFNSNPEETLVHSRPASPCSSVDDDSMSSTSERMSVIIGQEPSAVSIRSRMFSLEFSGDGSMPPERVFRDYSVLDGQDQDAYLTGSEPRYIDHDGDDHHLLCDGGYGKLQKLPERKLSSEQIENALVKIEEKHSTLQRKGTEMEKVLRSVDDPTQSPADGEMLKKWLELVHEKNVLMRKESELVHLNQQQKYEERQKEIEQELRQLVEMRDEVKSREQKQKEESLMKELLFVIDKRNCLIEQLEEERKKEHEEDTRIQELRHKKGSGLGPAVRPKATKSKLLKF